MGSVAPAASTLGRVHAVLARVDGAGSMLVWGRRVCDDHGAPSPRYVLDTVVLPRLNLSFYADFEFASGDDKAPSRMFLKSIEHAGFRLLPQAPPQLMVRLMCMPRASSRGACVAQVPRLERLVAGLPFSLLLESEAEESKLLFLVPTYAAVRLQLEMVWFP